MAKKFGFDPFILLSGLDDEGDDTVVGGGSGQSGVQPIEGAVPCSYGYWVEHYFNEDIDLFSDGPDVDDFIDWWLNNGFGADEWAELNPDLPPLEP